ncbi:MAG: 4Fe-4S binding protein [Coriobacteriia bacterium]|nr:4Fe-4S binding protein [Coriobacteriia bacterium]
MLRRVIKIDEEKCVGCGTCTEACHEKAIGIVDGKARLLRDDFCDGLGNCLPACPTKAISFEDRELSALSGNTVYAKKAGREVKAHKKCVELFESLEDAPCSQAHTDSNAPRGDNAHAGGNGHIKGSQLAQWPIQIKLIPPTAPFFNGAKLLIAADCCAFASAEFHERLMKDHITIIGCPKLDGVDYTERLTEAFRLNDIKSITIARMEVPCCGGIVSMAQAAYLKSEKKVPWRIATIAINGHIYDD